MDKIDRKILAALQSDGRLSITELADRVGISLSPCHRRLRALEESGAIKGYRAQLDLATLALNFSALVFVSMHATDHTTWDAFETAMLDLPNVIQAQRLFGDPDYLLHVVTRDLAEFRMLYDQHLSILPGVRRLTSTLVMKSIVEDRMLPLDAS